ncbi:MAG: phenylacetate--CoA ligase [Armatimonadota bacterium]|nr:phenylacetate--CoA ligase [Armatimonadota bacterium]
MIWDPERECADRVSLVQVQLERLRAVLARLAARVPFYRQRLAAALIDADGITALEDLRRLPLTTKDDLRRLYPFGLFATDSDEPVELHCSSGTTGTATLVGYTRRDLEIWSEVMARTLAAGGVRPGDLVHNAYGYGLFTGGLGFHYGALRLGARVLPISSGQTARQVRLLRELGATVLACTPSYALHLAEVVEEAGMGPLSLRVGLLGAEPWSEGMRREIERRLGITAVDVYGLSEIIGPGVACECAEARQGLHINEDHFLAEVVDPASGEVLPDGETGELVLTTLTKEATPLLRYRTGDLTALDRAPCPCGRQLARMARVRGRVDDMLVVRGVNVFPADVEAVLTSLGELAPAYQLIVDRQTTLDELEVQVEAREWLTPAASEGLAMRVAAAIRDQLGLRTRVTVLPPRQLPRSEGKALRVVDRRGLKEGVRR